MVAFADFDIQTWLIIDNDLPGNNCPCVKKYQSKILKMFGVIFFQYLFDDNKWDIIVLNAFLKEFNVNYF